MYHGHRSVEVDLNQPPDTGLCLMDGADAPLAHSQLSNQCVSPLNLGEANAPVTQPGVGNHHLPPVRSVKSVLRCPGPLVNYSAGIFSRPPPQSACPPRNCGDSHTLPMKLVNCMLSQGQVINWTADLLKDNKLISRIVTFDYTPFAVPPLLHISGMAAVACDPSLDKLPKFLVFLDDKNKPAAVAEWKLFNTFLWERDQIAYVRFDGWELLINPPKHLPEDSATCSVYISYRRVQGRGGHSSSHSARSQTTQTISGLAEPQQQKRDLAQANRGREICRSEPEMSKTEAEVIERKPQLPIVATNHTQTLTSRASMHPNYLKTLSQNHASWLFGGIAELIDNARDAAATRLDISIEMGKLTKEASPIPHLLVADNGKGMTHKEICRMLSFGHEEVDHEDHNKIGRFGVGFKSGSMRIGKDVVVLTQCQESRSLGFLSCSYNRGKDVLEIPIVTWRMQAGRMEVDLEAQSQDQAKKYLKAVKEHSQFDKFNIGIEFEKIKGTGTRIFVYNLERWGEKYRLKWDGKGDEEQHDIIIASRRPRARPGQTSTKVLLDYSLRAYVEVLFLHPKMKVYVQHLVVKTRRLDVSLSRTYRKDLQLGSKPLLLTLGFSSKEWQLANCGIFLYWHGRLIEAYKRVGRMVHSADIGHGVLGVLDTTSLWGGQGKGGVLNTKQGFEDSDAYAELERILGLEVQKYWAKEFERLPTVDDREGLSPDREWAQCDKCLKWRKLPPGFKNDLLPTEWFCYLPPYRGTCSTPEESSDDIVTVKVENGTATDSEITLDISTPQTDERAHLQDSGEDSPIPALRRRLTKSSEKRKRPMCEPEKSTLAGGKTVKKQKRIV